MSNTLLIWVIFIKFSNDGSERESLTIQFSFSNVLTDKKFQPSLGKLGISKNDDLCVTKFLKWIFTLASTQQLLPQDKAFW